MYQAISIANGQVVGEGQTASAALQAAKSRGYSAMDVLIKQASAGEGLIST